MVRKSKKQRFKAGSLGLTRVVSSASSMNAQRQASGECSLIPALGSGQQFGGKKIQLLRMVLGASPTLLRNKSVEDAPRVEVSTP